MTAIETIDLTKRYGDTLAVDGLSLAIPEGTVYGFLGPNGAGKTTTMRMLTTLTKPTSGEAYVAGQSVTDREAVTKRIGYLPEEPPIYDELTGREQLAYVAGLRDVPEAEAERCIAERLEAVGLAGDEDERVDDYSKGMRQKLAFAQATLHDPDVLFLDEPTSGLDPRAARSLRETIGRLADSGTTVFLSTHILPVVEEVADQVGVLADGRLVAEGSPTELVERAQSAGDGDGHGGRGSLEDVFLAVTGSPGDDTGGDGLVGTGDQGSTGGPTTNAPESTDG
jgi:ABC-2 type transport system ATP-binding protein